MTELKKSIKVLKSLQLKNGGILATPLDGAYPYVYVRDAVIMTKALNRSNLTKNSIAFYHFMNKNARVDQYKEIFHRYHKDGWPIVTRKKQYDNVGLLLHGIYDTYVYSKDKGFLKDMWYLVKRCSQFIFDFSKSGLVRTETSIHERYRLEMGYEIWSNCACTRGLYDAAEIANILGHKKESELWLKKAKHLHKNIRSKMFNKKTGLYMKNKRFPRISDSSQIAPFYFNLEDSQKILKKTLLHLEKNLWYKELGGYRRFRKFEVVKDWHWYSGGSGGWIVFTAIIGRMYRELNHKSKCIGCEKWIEDVGKKTNGLLPEHISTKLEYDEWKRNEIEFNSRILMEMKKVEKLNEKFKRKYKQEIVYWANPLGWAHAEYILLKNCIKDKSKCMT